MWKRRNGTQQRKMAADHGLARRLIVPVPLVLIVAVAGPAARMQAVVATAAPNDSQWKEF